MKNIAIFASYNGSFLDTLYKASKDKTLDINISLVISNNTNANALKKGQAYHIPSFVVNDKLYEDTEKKIDELLKTHGCNLIVLSGYMKKISSNLARNYTIINSHPALLPEFGGKGMYGRFVHEAVIKAGVKQSGATIHYVNENYDEGAILYQKAIDIESCDTPESLEIKVKALEQEIIIDAIKCLK